MGWEEDEELACEWCGQPLDDEGNCPVCDDRLTVWDKADLEGDRLRDEWDEATEAPW